MGQFRGVTFGGENVTPKNDGGLYGAHFSDGVLFGCEMSIVDDTLQIESGEFIAGGRVVMVDGATNVDLSGRTETDGYIRVIFNIVLGNDPEYYISYVEYPSTTFPALTQENINLTGTTYQLQLAVVQESGGNLSLYSSLGGSGLISSGSIKSDGSLQISADGERRSVSFYNSGVIAGRFRYNAITGYTEAGSVNTDGTLKAGIRADTKTEVFANNDDIRFYPKGVSNSTNGVTLDANGQFHGGHLTKPDATIVSKAVNSAWTELCSVNLDVMGTASLKCLGASSDDWGMIGIGHTSSATNCRNSTALGGSTAVYLGLNAFLLIEVTSNNYSVSLYANSSANTTAQNCILRAVQLG